MPAETSSIECRWLQSNAGGDSNCCRLLQELTGLTGPGNCPVGSDACRACLKWYSPTVDHLNPVVASLLYILTSQILGTGGVSGCNREKAERLRQLALTAIPHDYDATPVTDQIESQKNLHLSDIGHLIPRPLRRYGPRVSEWAVAVTTAPRQQATLDRCLRSIQAAGWAEPRVIADGDQRLSPNWEGLPVTRREPQIGAWPSYYLTLVELLMRQPSADAFLVVQDDVVFFEHPSLREYLESVLWPNRRLGIVSLYCSRAYSQSTPGWYRLDQSLVWGGQALIFARETLIQFLCDPMVVRHRFINNGIGGIANIDGLVGQWAFETDTPVYVSSPSLSQHIGHVSSLWKDSKAFVNRSAGAFAGNYSAGSVDSENE